MRERSHPAGLVGGRVVHVGNATAELVSIDPGWTSRVVGRFAVAPALVDEAVGAARAAFRGWRFFASTAI